VKLFFCLFSIPSLGVRKGAILRPGELVTSKIPLKKFPPGGLTGLSECDNIVSQLGRGVTVEIKVTTDDLVSVAEAAKVLGRPRLTIYRWIDAGKIHGIKLGGILFIPKSEVERIKNKQAAEGLTQTA